MNHTEMIKYIANLSYSEICLLDMFIKNNRRNCYVIYIVFIAWILWYIKVRTHDISIKKSRTKLWFNPKYFWPYTMILYYLSAKRVIYTTRLILSNLFLLYNCLVTRTNCKRTNYRFQLSRKLANEHCECFHDSLCAELV